MIDQADYDAAVEVAATRMRGLRDAIELFRIQAEQMADHAAGETRRCLDCGIAVQRRHGPWPKRCDACRKVARAASWRKGYAKKERRPGGHRWRAYLQPISCAWCGSSFQPESATKSHGGPRKYCGVTCAARDRSARRKQITCEQCGQDAEVGVGGTGTRFCSKKCQQAWHTTRRTALAGTTLTWEELPEELAETLVLRTRLNRELWRLRNGR